MTGGLLLPLLLAACGLLGGDPIPPDCDPRAAWYPDTDADGIGEGDRVYVGCDAPEGWTQTPPYPPDTDDTDDAEPPDTEDSDDTDDTEPPDTDDTDVGS